MYWVFVHTVDRFNCEAIVLNDKNEKRFWDLREKIEGEDCELVWDSAPTLEMAFQYAEEEYSAYPRRCTNCQNFLPVDLYQGKKYDFSDERWRVFTIKHRQNAPYFNKVMNVYFYVQNHYFAIENSFIIVYLSSRR